MDDIFVIFLSKVVDTIHDAIGKTFCSIKFIYEEEQNGSLSFQDIIETRGPKGGLNITFYRKTTDTDHYLDFDSCHPMDHKQAVLIYTFLKRARDLPVTIEDKRGEVKHLQSVLKANDYPDRFIFTENGSDLGGPQHQSGSQQQPKSCCVLPFVCGVSLGIGRVLKLAGMRQNF